MADRASASILIGGVIPCSCFSGLFEAIDRDGGRADWEGEPLDPASLRPGETLAAYAYAQPGGMFEWTEQFCEDHGIAFVRDSGSCSGVFGPERVVFTGTGTPAQFDMTENEEIVLARSIIRALGTLKAIEAWFESAEFQPPANHLRRQHCGHRREWGDGQWLTLTCRAVSPSVAPMQNWR